MVIGPVIGDVLGLGLGLVYIHASPHRLHMLNSLYHLRLITHCGSLTLYCVLYLEVNWPAVCSCRLSHWYVFIYKSILGKITNIILLIFSFKHEITISVHFADFTFCYS